MLKIEKTKQGTSMNIALKGKLDTSTAPQLQDSLKEDMDSLTELVIDMKDLEYLSSAGLRVLLLAQKTMNTQGTMVVKNPNDLIMDIFDDTGFSNILTIE